MTDTYTFPIGLEEGPDGATRVHALSLPGCTAEGTTRDAALDAFPPALSAWLGWMHDAGEPVPPPGAELEIAVEEWIRTEADVGAGESNVCFEADRQPLSAAEVEAGLRWLGELRRPLLAALRNLPDAALDRPAPGGWTARQAVEELARAQWWTLGRLGASPLGELPARTLGRLDTALALVMQQFRLVAEGAFPEAVELDDEVWTPRKVLRRLLMLEATLGRVVRQALLSPGQEPA